MSIKLRTFVYVVRWNYNQVMFNICIKLTNYLCNHVAYKHLEKQKKLTSNYRKRIGPV